MAVDLVVIGTAITFGPLHNSAFILLLASRRGARKGLVFLLSWLADLVAVVACVMVLTGGKPLVHDSTPSTAAVAAKLAIGVGLIVFGGHRYRQLPRPYRPPHWTARIDNASLGTAAALAWLLQPWALVAAGAATVVDADLSTLTDWLTLTGYCLLATLSLLIMQLCTVLAPEAARSRLRALRTWLETHQEQLIVALSLLAGLWLTGSSSYTLAT
ncbi:GAP family protein [Streptomyces sp. NPDC059378]|uniref:GAP family protein n=1 Tax=Streptomyces sp. NPDC059378 TaxID=3346815 RepID=UPI00367A4021